MQLIGHLGGGGSTVCFKGLPIFSSTNFHWNTIDGRVNVEAQPKFPGIFERKKEKKNHTRKQKKHGKPKCSCITNRNILHEMTP